MKKGKICRIRLGDDSFLDADLCNRNGFKHCYCSLQRIMDFYRNRCITDEFFSLFREIRL